MPPGSFNTPGPPSARSNRSVRTEVTEVLWEISESETPTAVECFSVSNTSDTNNNSNQPPPAPVLEGTDTGTAISPLSLSRPLIAVGKKETVIGTQTDLTASSVVDSSEYFTATSAEASSSNDQRVHRISSLLDFNRSRPALYNLGRPVISHMGEEAKLPESSSGSSGIGEGHPVDFKYALAILSNEEDIADRVHSPPNPRDEQHYKRDFNPKGPLRQQVTRTQSMRIFPPEGYIESAEDRLIRYRPAVCSSNNEDALVGKHPLQSAQLKPHPLKPSAPVSQTVREGSSASMGLSKGIVVGNRKRPRSEGSFVADISIPDSLNRSRKKFSPIAGNQQQQPRSLHSKSGESSVKSDPCSHISEFGYTLTRSAARIPEEPESGTNTPQTDVADANASQPSSPTLRQSISTSALANLPAGTISTTELLRSFNEAYRSDCTDSGECTNVSSNTRSSIERRVVCDEKPREKLTRESITSSSLFQVAATTTITKGNPGVKSKNSSNQEITVERGDTVTQVSGFQRSPLERQQEQEPPTASAVPWELREEAKMFDQRRDRGTDGIKGWWWDLWDGLKSAFTC